MLDNEQGSESGLACYYTTPMSNSINEYHDFKLPTLAMAATSMNKK
jgi:hypothetical protein